MRSIGPPGAEDAAGRFISSSPAGGGRERLRALSVGGEGWVIPGLESEARAGLVRVEGFRASVADRPVVRGRSFRKSVGRGRGVRSGRGTVPRPAPGREPVAVEAAGVAGRARRWGGRPSGSAVFPSERGPTAGRGRRGGRGAIGVVNASGDAAYGGKPPGWRGLAGRGETT